MKNRSWLIVTVFSLMAAACTSAPQEQGKMMHHQDGQQMQGGMMGGMARMDANGDGMLSKQEFMQAHDTMFERMKNKDGVIERRDGGGVVTKEEFMKRHEMMFDRMANQDGVIAMSDMQCPMMGGGHKMMKHHKMGGSRT